MRYYFNIRDDQGLIADDEGSELPGIAAARAEADAIARDFASDDLRSGRRVSERQIEIADKGRVLESVSVCDVVGLTD